MKTGSRPFPSSALLRWPALLTGLGLLSVCPSALTGATSDLAIALDAPDLVFVPGDPPRWFSQATVTHDGVDAAQGEADTWNTPVRLETTVVGPGNVSFWWKVQGAGILCCHVILDGQENPYSSAGVSPESDWWWRTVELGPGTNRIVWSCDNQNDNPEDDWTTTAWLDEVVVAAPGRECAPFFTRAPSSQTVWAANPVNWEAVVAGYPGPDLQWYHDGTPIPGATNSWLYLFNAQAQQAGVYTLVASNRLGTASVSATLTIEEQPPRFYPQPVSQSLALGMTALFEVSVYGTEPIALQWRKNGTNIPGATQASLVLTQVTRADAGIYSVVASNSVVTVTSQDAQLAVTPVFAFPAQGTIPLDLADVVAVKANGYHSLALKRDGTVVGWGNSPVAPPPVQASLTNLVAIACGFDFDLALRADGTVVAWGSNQWGQLNVPAGLSNVVAIACGWNHSLALRREGTVVAWGYPHYDLNTVPAHVTNVVAIGCNWFENLALLANGAVVAWGGDNIQPPPGLSDVVALAAGPISLSVALKRDGTVTAWGQECCGAVSEAARLSNVVAIAAGGSHGLALMPDHRVQAWGYDDERTQVPASLANVAAVAAGIYQSLALIGEGAPFITQPLIGRVGYTGTTTDFRVSAVGELPLRYQWQRDGADIAGATNAILSLSHLTPGDAGAYRVIVSNARGAVHSMATLRVVASAPFFTRQPVSQVKYLGEPVTFVAQASGSGPISYQWQQNAMDLPGATTAVLDLLSARTRDMGAYSVVVRNALGTQTSAAADLTLLNVVVWGTPAGWRSVETPVTVTNATAIASSTDDTCLAVTADGRVVAWDDNHPYGTNVPPGGLADALAVAVGPDHSLALRRDGTVAGWYHSNIGHNGQAEPPPGLNHVVAVAAGNVHSVALRSNGTVVAWGDNTAGQLAVPPDLSAVVAISAGCQHTLALRADGTVAGWGLDLADYHSEFENLTDIVAIACGQFHDLALKRNGTVVAWGHNYYGQTEVPPGLTNVVALAAGAFRSAAVTADGRIVSWGLGSEPPPTWLSNVTAAACGQGVVMALIGDGSPAITVQPFSQCVRLGDSVTLTALAAGTPPLSYQWLFNGLPIPDATNSTFVIRHSSFANAGAYAVVVSNAAGSVTSDAAWITLLPGVPGPGSPDVTFTPAIQRPEPHCYSAPVQSIVVQPDGRLLVAGNFIGVNGRGQTNLVRLLPDGTADLEFQWNLPAFPWNASGMSFSPSVVVLQPDGKILVGGNGREASGEFTGLVRLNADGRQDSSFHFFGTATDLAVPVRALALQPDGRILVSGTVPGLGAHGNRTNFLARLHSNGSLDATFQPLYVLDEDQFGVRSIAVQSDGKIVIAGDQMGLDWPRYTLARLNADGSLDTSYEPQIEYHVQAIALQPDGRLLIAGSCRRVNGVRCTGVARLNVDGSLDATFDCRVWESSAYQWVPTMALQPDGRVLVAAYVTSPGQPSQHEFTVARIHANGTLDTSFQTEIQSSETMSYLMVATMALQADGQVLIGGWFTEVGGMPQKYFARLGSGGPIAPAIAAQPEDQCRFVGQTARFRVVAEGTPPLAYQWFFNDQPLPDATSAELVLPSIQFSQAGSYSVVVSNAAGVLASTPATLTVLPTRTGPGAVDFSFDPTADGERIGLASAQSSVSALVLQPDGKVVIGGNFIGIHGEPRQNLARLNADGSLDLSFPAGGGTDGGIQAMARQSDGKILIAGSFTTVNHQPRPSLARLNSDGTLDSEFVVDLGPGGCVYAISVQMDGRILIGGSFTAVNGVTRTNLARLNPDGQVDASFIPPPELDGYYDRPQWLQELSDGKWLVGGRFEQANKNLVRLNPDGSLDPGFNCELEGGSLVSAAVRSDGSIVAAGALHSWSGGSHYFALVLLDANGATVTEVSPEDLAHIVTSVAVDAENNVLIAGYFTAAFGQPRRGVARLNCDLTLDVSFDPGSAFGAEVNPTSALLVLPNRRILVGASSTGRDLSSRTLVCLSPNGQLDPGWDIHSVGVSGVISALAQQPDGKVYAGGSFDSVNGQPRHNLARLYADGTLDPSFVPDLAADFQVLALGLQPDGKLLVAGKVLSTDPVVRIPKGLVRLNPDGSVDSSFVVSAPEGIRYVRALVLQPDGKILIGGEFRFDGYGGLARLNPDGSIDASFLPPHYPDYDELGVDTLALQPDGKILVGGDFEDSERLGKLERLNADGSVDTSFHLNLGTNTWFQAAPENIVLQPDGKILVTSGAPNAPTRLHPDGSRDLSFAPQVPAWFRSIALQPDGRILAAGGDGEVRLLNTDGSLDSNFQARVGSRAEVYAMLVQADGHVLIGGDFSSVNGVPMNDLARLNGGEPLVTPFPHPADTTAPQWTMSIGEVTGYGAAWRRGQTWPVPPNPIPIDYVTRAAMLWRRGECYQFNDRTNAPLCWVNCDGGAGLAPAPQAEGLLGPLATRQLPSGYTPGEPVRISLTVNPPPTATAYAVEDQPPAGWTVTNISHGGGFDAASGKVKFGPFFDPTPRVLTYVATPRAGDGGRCVFTGAASVDGSSVTIGGGSETMSVSSALTDTDQDGLPDFWEQAYGLNPNDPSDARQDPDGDGRNNLEEYQAGTNPIDAASVLRLQLSVSNNVLCLRFWATAGFTYQVHSATNLANPFWQTIRNIPNPATSQEITVPEPIARGMRCYRVAAMPAMWPAVTSSGSGQVRFSALAGYAYLVEYTETIVGPWQPLEYVLKTTTQSVTVTDPVPRVMGFYRLRRLGL